MDRISIRSFVCVDAFDGLGQLQFSKGGVQTVLGSQDIPCGPPNNCTCEIFPVCGAGRLLGHAYLSC